MMKEYEEILDYVNSLRIIDSHEHLPTREDNREKNTDILREYLGDYIGVDLMAMGLPGRDYHYARDTSVPLTERWKCVEPYWNLTRNTGYARTLDIAVQGIYDIPRMEGDTIEELNSRFLKTLEPGQQHYKRILKEMSKIEYSILDPWDFNFDPGHDPLYFRSAFNICPLITMVIADYEGNIMELLESHTGIKINSFDTWLLACEAEIENALKMGAVSFKCQLAYWRSLSFENVDRRVAEEYFESIIHIKDRFVWGSRKTQTPKEFQDYMMHFILRILNKKGMVLQVHTGLHNKNSSDIRNSDPTMLINLLRQYPSVKFDLFHIGYPYEHMLSAIAKVFPNVYLNMCWAHVISPAASVTILNEWLDSVPLGKIIAFGGDHGAIDHVYAHQLLARQNVSRVLAGKVHNGVFDMDMAKYIAKRVFYENPKALYEGV